MYALFRSQNALHTNMRSHALMMICFGLILTSYNLLKFQGKNSHFANNFWPMDPTIVSEMSKNVGIDNTMLFKDLIKLLNVNTNGNLVILKHMHFLGLKIFLIYI